MKLFHSRTPRLSLKSLLFVSAIIFSSLTHIAYAESQKELKTVKNEISRQQHSIESQKRKFNSLQKSLKQQELQISKLEKEIRATQSSLNTSNQKLVQLEDKIQQLEVQKHQQSEKLTELIQTYYVTDRAHSAASVLSSGVEADRMSQYFQYLAKQRAKAIKDLERTKQELESNQQQLKLEKDNIAQLLEQQKDKLSKLKTAQAQRKSTLTGIKKDISSDKVYLSELQRNETRLKAEIAKAERRTTISMNGLASQKGRLPWPLKGRILHYYGASQAGLSKWKGIVIDAKYGEPVKAVSSGTIVFSDYLRGYGLVVLIDHGKGYMTLYGFNQTLLRKEGDKVTAGETIALAGDTGGQAQPSLYFEIRKNSKTQNPLSWLSKR
ncbi:murein hydrolase activator EnvC [Vibrio sp. S4M6]|nr:murein hydrolase activator EnvC [Vibrio sinus]MCL9783838.1 murein hydrolase activator EnvC [Vibrio sinus]